MYMYLAGNSRGVLDSQGKNVGYYVFIIFYLFVFFFFLFLLSKHNCLCLHICMLFFIIFAHLNECS